MDKSLRDQAVEHLKQASALLKQAGASDDLAILAWQEQSDVDGEELYETIPCAVCGDSHQLDLALTRPANMHFQYALEMTLRSNYHDWSFWTKVKALGRLFKALFIHKSETQDFLVPHGDAVRRLKDFMGRM
jgi:hypothetical protein